MKRKYYQILISETSRSCPAKREENHIFNEVEKKFETYKEAKEFLIEKYGKNPFSSKRNRQEKGIFIDTKEGTKQIGIHYSFWNKDWSHNSKSWWQTDWIELHKVCESREPLFV